LILIDEADRLKISSLEQVRAHYDTGGVGVVLIGMPGIEKRLSRYPQLYSRIGFVHEFRPLGLDQLTRLFERHWSPAGVQLPASGPDAETVATILRVTRGNFRLLSRLLAQVERILAVNELTIITRDVIEPARQSLVIGAA
jgi:DNA transposition AAA+ family ATPase